jgi:hypothetical protein
MNKLFDVNEIMNAERHKLSIIHDNDVVNLNLIYKNLYKLYEKLDLIYENELYSETLDAIDTAYDILQTWNNILFL